MPDGVNNTWALHPINSVMFPSFLYLTVLDLVGGLLCYALSDL